ncbi:hypothetical protein T08_15080 [Trichinella sp. T8]|nr:hypothetical protein T08_15080 [Trichinella sp. T8]
MYIPVVYLICERFRNNSVHGDIVSSSVVSLIMFIPFRTNYYQKENKSKQPQGWYQREANRLNKTLDSFETTFDNLVEMDWKCQKIGLLKTKIYCTRMRILTDYCTGMPIMINLFHKHEILFNQNLQDSLIYPYVKLAIKRIQNFEKVFFIKNAKTAKSIAHEISKFSKILFFSNNNVIM